MVLENPVAPVRAGLVFGVVGVAGVDAVARADADVLIENPLVRSYVARFAGSERTSCAVCTNWNFSTVACSRPKFLSG